MTVYLRTWLLKRSSYLGREVWFRFCRDRLAVIGMITLIAIALGVAVGPWLYPLSPTQIDFSQSLQAPSFAHPFGTNDLGQDQLARVLIGGRISLAVALAAMAIALLFGTSIGIMAGFYGSWLDAGLMRLTDLFLSLPPLPLVLLLVYLFRDSLKAIAGAELGIFLLVVGVIGGLNWMSVARLVRATVLQLREREFMVAAIALGAPPYYLLYRHIFPNVFSIIIVAATQAVGTAMLTESTLSFLGLGFPPDIPTWGQMLYQAKDYLASAPYLAVFPGLCIFFAVLSLNYLGDGLRDIFDPRT